MEGLQINSVEELLQGILSELKAQRVPDDLWTVDDIAKYIKKTPSTVRSHVVNKRDFPRPIKTPSSRWIAKEVKAYFLKRR